MTIPFSSLKFIDGSTSWRFRPYRWNHQNNEQSTWVRDNACRINFEKPLGKFLLFKYWCWFCSTSFNADLHFETHVFFANYAFLALFFLCILHSITVYYSRLLSNNYTLGYISFCLVLFIYLRIIFFGPKIGPGINYTEADLMLQVVSQKMVVLSFMVAILHQVVGFNKLLKKKTGG